MEQYQYIGSAIIRTILFTLVLGVIMLLIIHIVTWLNRDHNQINIPKITTTPAKISIKPKALPIGYNDIPYKAAPKSIIPQLSPKATPKTDATTIIIATSVPYTYNSTDDIGVKSGKKYASWSTKTGYNLIINDGFNHTTVSPTFTNHPTHKWARTYQSIFLSVIQSINTAINHDAKTIEIVFDYDGVWQYAAGYWQPTTPESQDYVNELSKITTSHPDFKIIFTKLNFIPQNRFSKATKALAKALKKQA